MIVVQITDFHVGGEVVIDGRRVDPLMRLHAAVAHINTLRPRPELVLATGDLTWDGQPREYALVKRALAVLAMPFFIIPGNHDHRANLRDAFFDHEYLRSDEDFLHHAVEGYPLRLIGLDTLVPGQGGGTLCRRRLDWLDTRLRERPEAPTLVYMHHPPFRTGIAEFDAMGCQGKEELGNIVMRHPQIEGIVCGHVHRSMHLKWHGTVVNVAPSTAFQYPLDLSPGADLQPVDEPPACAVHVWTPEGGVVSHLSYVPSVKAG